MNINRFFCRFSHSQILRIAAVSLVALACSTSALCDEIHDASAAGELAKVQSLLKDNPELVAKSNEDGWEPLHLAAQKGHKDVAELLLANKAEVNAKNNSGDTALKIASNRGFKEIVELLRRHGGHE